MKIKIKCPECGAVLNIEDSPDNSGKKVKCPVCKTVNIYGNFKRVGTPVDGSKAKDEDCSTSIAVNRQSVVMKLVDQDTGIQYRLHEGVNKVGRMTVTTPPKADIAITRGEGCEDMGFSREHMIIDVKSMKDGLMHAFISNDRNKNRTYVNGEELADGNALGLNNGDLIKSSATVLRFVAESSDSARSHDSTEL